MGILFIDICLLGIKFIGVVIIISWPCILKLEGDDDLIYLASEQEFMSQCHELIFSDDDYVIDSAGFSYLISEKLALIKTQRIFVVGEVTDLIRASEFTKAELCLTKIYFITVSAAIQSQCC